MVISYVVKAGCIVLMIYDSDYTVLVFLHTNDLYFTTCPINNIYHIIMCGVFVYFTILRFLSARSFSQIMSF